MNCAILCSVTFEGSYHTMESHADVTSGIRAHGGSRNKLLDILSLSYWPANLHGGDFGFQYIGGNKFAYYCLFL